MQSHCQPLFDIIDGEILKQITKDQNQAKCLVLLAKKSSMMTSNSSTGKNQYFPRILQINNEYVVQICPKTQKAISAVLCDYGHQFEIIRKPSVDTQVGEPQGIIMYLKHFQKPVQCLIQGDSRSQLEKFAIALGKKYIVQTGFHKLFKAVQKIDQGMTACVYSARQHATGKIVAIKSFKRSIYFVSENNTGETAFKKEFKFLTELSHKNICEFQGVFQTENSTYIIMELLPLSLINYLRPLQIPNQIDVKKLMKGLLEGVDYLHKKGIMHRDLKLQNIMLKKDPHDSGSFIPVIIDFGLAEYQKKEQYLYVRCGTIGYVAPQILRIKQNDQTKTYSCKCDIFSLGVAFYIMLFKQLVFQGESKQQIKEKNYKCEINFGNENFSKLSSQGNDLFRRMLDQNPQTRISAEEALNHPYFTGEKLGKKEAQTEQTGTKQSIDIDDEEQCQTRIRYDKL